jgi:hypothetical protein
MRRNKSSKTEDNVLNKDIDVKKKRLIRKRNNYDDNSDDVIRKNKKTKKFSLNIQNTEEDDFIKVFNCFNQKNIINNTKKSNSLATFTIDIYLLYSNSLKLEDDFVPVNKLNEIIIKKQSSSNEIYVNDFDEDFLNKHLLSLSIIRNINKMTDFKFNILNFIPICKFKFNSFDIICENSSLSIGKIWLLPNLEFLGLWESLEFSINVKEELLDYCNASLKFSNSRVNHKIISYNRLIILLGEPGCGKTSLAKAFSQKLSIKHVGDYKCYKLIDINSQFLLSEYYSQSGKLLTILFQKLKELSIINFDTFYIILIDEIESMLTSRDLHSNNSNEPLDSLRAVNVILTHLDQIKLFENILIITTSNFSEMLDTAFLDRADLKFIIKQPSLKGIYKIYMTCINELIKKNLIPKINFSCVNEKFSFNKLIFKLCKESVGLSGRLLRKLPFLAYCKLDVFTIENFLLVLINEIRLYKENRNDYFAD